MAALTTLLASLLEAHVCHAADCFVAAVNLIAMATPEDMRADAEHIRMADQFVEVGGCCSAQSVVTTCWAGNVLEPCSSPASGPLLLCGCASMPLTRLSLLTLSGPGRQEHQQLRQCAADCGHRDAHRRGRRLARLVSRQGSGVGQLRSCMAACVVH